MQISGSRWLLVSGALLASLALVACGDDDASTGPSPDSGAMGQPRCTPSQSEWDARIAALVAQRCGLCHGQTAEFGAPFSLADYATLVEGTEGLRIVDFMASRVSEGTMPPIGAGTLPSLMERDEITSWASCGDVRVDTPVGLDTNRPPYVSPTEIPAGLRTIDLTLDAFPVGATLRDWYEEADFTQIVEEDVFIRRIDAVIDDSRVVHHLTLRSGDPSNDAGMSYLYTWAPGTGAFQFPEGGMRLRRGDNLRLQVHYNNGAGVPDVTDSSGIRLWVGPVEGEEYAMADPGPGAFGFTIPARGDGTIESTCTVREPVRVVATMPHMHEIGDTFELDIVRDGTTTNVLRLGAWSFDNQLFYELPLELDVGDQLTVRCTFANPSSDVVRAGPRTQDEMCFAFTYVTPASPDFCGPAGANTIAYRPGACFDDPAEVEVVAPEIVMDVDAPAFDATAPFPTGRWRIADALIATPSPTLVRAATFNLAGQMSFATDQIQIDAAVHVIAPTGELAAGRQFDLSFAGTLDSTVGESTLTATCGGLAPGTTVGVVEGRPAMRIPLTSAVELEVWVFFE